MFSWTNVCVVISCCQSLELRRGRQLAVDEQVGDLEVRRVLGELLDRVAAVLEDAVRAVEVRDRRAARRRVHERGVVRHEPEVVLGDADRAEVQRAHGAVGDRDLVGAPGAVVGDAQRLAAARPDRRRWCPGRTRRWSARCLSAYSRPPIMPPRAPDSERRACEILLRARLVALPAAAEEAAEAPAAGVRAERRARPWSPARAGPRRPRRRASSVTRRSAIRATSGASTKRWPRRRVDHEAVEDVLGDVLEHLAHGADLAAVGCDDRGARLEHLVGDRVAVVVRARHRRRCRPPPA